MATVCVIGGGPAGVSAANESAERGASVTLLEKSERIGPRRSSWAQFIRVGSDERLPEVNRAVRTGVDLRLDECAQSVSADRRVITNRGRRCFDSVVIATGSTDQRTAIKGKSKSGSFILSDLAAFRSLAGAAESAEKVVVAGEGILALSVAERLRQVGIDVVLVSTVPPLGGLLAQALFPTIRATMQASGVELVVGEVERILGLGKVEAVVCGGAVMRCDVVAIVPELRPSLPITSVKLVQDRFVQVDSKLRTVLPRVFAAGSCAEFGPAQRLSSLSPSIMPELSGRIAGANAAGGTASFSQTATFSTSLFGLHITVSGLSLSHAISAGFEASEVTKTDGESSCAIVYDKGGGDVLGIQMIGPEGRVLQFPLAGAAGSVPLVRLAYQQAEGSTDITLIAEAAREAIRKSR